MRSEILSQACEADTGSLALDTEWCKSIPMCPEQSEGQPGGGEWGTITPSLLSMKHQREIGSIQSWPGQHLQL